MYTRNRSVPTNPNTGAQAAVRANFAAAAQQWMLLTDVERASWALYASNVSVVNRLGDTVFLTGQQMYIRTTSFALQVGLGPFPTAPSIFNLGQIGDLSLGAPDASAHTVPLTFDPAADWVNTDNASLFVYVSRPVSPTINFFKGPFNLTAQVDGDATTPPTSPKTLTIDPSQAVVNTVIYAQFRALYPDGRLTNAVIAASEVAVP